jgi:hypothetical protein
MRGGGERKVEEVEEMEVGGKKRKVTNVTQLSPAFIPFPYFALFGSSINKRVLRRVIS